MYQHIVLAILFSIFMFCLNSMLAQDEWRKIYNGKDMDGWEQTGVGHFTVEPDGTLKTHDGLGCLIYTKEKFGNIRLRVSYKLEAPLMNGGVNSHIAKRPPQGRMGSRQHRARNSNLEPRRQFALHGYCLRLQQDISPSLQRDGLEPSGIMDDRAALLYLLDQKGVKVTDYHRWGAA